MERRNWICKNRFIAVIESEEDNGDFSNVKSPFCTSIRKMEIVWKKTEFALTNI